MTTLKELQSKLVNKLFLLYLISYFVGVGERTRKKVIEMESVKGLWCSIDLKYVYFPSH